MDLTARTILLTAATLGCCCAAAGAQSGSVWDTLRPVEPGRSDLSPLAVETRTEPVELRRALGFESLFRGQGRDGQNWFARRDAGVTAVFERSVYAQTRAGEVAMIPPGTTFVIGEPSSILASRLGIGTLGARAARDASGGLRIDTREDTRLDTRVGSGGAARRASDGAFARRDPAGRRGVSGLLRLAAMREKLGG